MNQRRATLDVTSEVAKRIRAVEDALAVSMVGAESSARVDVAKLALADAVMRQLSKAVAPVKAALSTPKARRRA